MSFSGLFAIGLSGLNAQAASLEAVSQNIANTETTGYKRTRTDFSTLVASLASEGGIEGGGVAATGRTLVAEQGAVSDTGTATDLAISGDGFFVVTADPTPSAERLFTRAGGFSPDANGDLVNEAGMYLLGLPVAENGAAPAGALAGLRIVNISGLDALGAATEEITLAGNLSADAASGETATQHFQIYDADGAARNVAIRFTARDDGAFDAVVFAPDDGDEILASGTIAFTADGQIDANLSTLPFSFSPNAGERVDLDLTGLASREGATIFTTASADGAAAGAFEGVEIGENGRVAALFANGLSRDIYQLVLANFVNPAALEEGAASTFRQTTDAGALSLDSPLAGRAGGVASGALELSTVDIGQEFSTLIETQRAYSANSRILTIADEMWRTLDRAAS